MTVQYRCFPCQDVLDTVEEWRTHMMTHGEAIFSAAGVIDPPAPEERASVDDTLVQSGVKAIIAGNYTSGHMLRPDVQAAIRARLAVDADPYWMMSDDYNCRPQARLTDEGREYARTQGWLVMCVDHIDDDGPCHRETLSVEAGGTDHCSSCLSSLDHYGPPSSEMTLCGMCYVTFTRRNDPTFILPPKNPPWSLSELRRRVGRRR